MLASRCGMPNMSEETNVTETHCNTLQHTAVCPAVMPLCLDSCNCNTRQHTATHGNTQQNTAKHGNTQRHTITHCSCPAGMLGCLRYAEHVKSDLIKSKETDKRPVIGPSVKRDLSKMSKDTNVNPKRPSNYLSKRVGTCQKRPMYLRRRVFVGLYLGTIQKLTNYLEDMCRSGGLPNVSTETYICQNKPIKKTYVILIRPKVCWRLICVLLLSGELPVMCIY